MLQMRGEKEIETGNLKLRVFVSRLKSQLLFGFLSDFVLSFALALGSRVVFASSLMISHLAMDKSLHRRPGCGRGGTEGMESFYGYERLRRFGTNVQVRKTEELRS